MEFHDSEIIELNLDGERGHILFHGVIYRSMGSLLANAKESGWQNLRMHLTGMRFEGEPIPDYNYVSRGDLWLDGEKVKYFVPVPLDFQGKVEIAMLVGEDFLTRKIYADSVSTSLEGEFRLETLWDADGNSTAA